MGILKYLFLSWVKKNPLKRYLSFVFANCGKICIAKTHLSIMVTLSELLCSALPVFYFWMERSFSRLALEFNLALTKVRFYYQLKKFTSHVLCVICNDVMLWKRKEKNTVLPISALNGSTVLFAIFMKFYQYPFSLCNKNRLQRIRYLTDIFIFILKMWMYGRKLLRNNYLGNCWLGGDLVWHNVEGIPNLYICLNLFLLLMRGS